MSIYSVATHDELMSALSSASGGDEIVLAAGDYGDLTVKSMTFDTNLTIRSADPDNPAVFDSVHLAHTDNVTFDSIVVDMPVDENTIETDFAVRIANSDNVTFSNSTLIGGDAVNGIDPSEPAGSQGAYGITGYPIGRAVYISDSDNSEFSDLSVSGFNKGIIVADSDGVMITDNEFFDIRSDAITGSGVDNVLIEGNHVKDINAWNMGGGGDHPDYIHLYIGKDQVENSQNITIRDNFFEQGDGVAPLGLHFSNYGNDVEFNNVLIENNVIQNGESASMRLGAIDGLIVRDNTLIPTNTISTDEPGIFLIYETRNAVIENNILSKVYGDPLDEAAVRNIVVGDNLYVQNTDPIAENYVGDIFVNGLDSDAGLPGLRTTPGSEADGYGADVSAFDITPDSLDGYVVETRGTGLGLDTHEFSVEMFLGEAGLIDTTDAKVTWNFGDGTTATGTDVTHTFDAAGTTNVTATVTIPGQDPVTLEKQIFVTTPNALEIKFDGSAKDLSSIENVVTLEGSAKIVDSEYGQALSLGDRTASATVEQNSEILDNPEFTYTVAIKKDADAVDETGFATYFSGTAVIKVLADGVQLVGKTDLGEDISLRASDLDLNNTDWHSLTYVFSQSEGRATLYVDGDKVDEVTGLKGSQITGKGHDLTIGGPSGTSLQAEYDNIQFLRGALSDEQVATSHDTFIAGEATTIPDPTPVAVPEDASGPIETIEPEPVLPAEEPAPAPEPVAPKPEPIEEEVVPTPEPVIAPETEEPVAQEEPAPQVEEPIVLMTEETPEPTEPTPEVTEPTPDAPAATDDTDAGDILTADDKDGGKASSTSDEEEPSAGPFGFIQKFFNAIMRMFGGGSKDTETKVSKKADDSDAETKKMVSLEDVVPITESLPEDDDSAASKARTSDHDSEYDELLLFI